MWNHTVSVIATVSCIRVGSNVLRPDTIKRIEMGYSTDNSDSDYAIVTTEDNKGEHKHYFSEEEVEASIDWMSIRRRNAPPETK